MVNRLQNIKMNSFSFLICVIYYTLPVAISEIAEEASDEPKGLRSGTYSSDEKKHSAMKNKQYLSEIARGDMADSFSTNIHKNVPVNFPDFGRRFVLQYPYSSKPASQIDDEAEERLDSIIQEALRKAERDNNHEGGVHPVKAPAHVVLAMARQAILSQNSRPLKDQALPQEALRSGNYWNSVWKEEVSEPKSNLRSEKQLESVRVKIMPGSKLYKLVSMTKDMSPKLLYVINDNTDEE